MKAILIAVFVMGMGVVPVLATDYDQPGQYPAAAGSGNQQRPGIMPFEQKRAEILQHIDQRITDSQSEKLCVQGAKSHEELRACREKYRPRMRAEHQPRNQQR